MTRGISISSSLVPPWLPMCRWRDSPAVQSFTVVRPRITSATSPMRSAKRGCGVPGRTSPVDQRAARHHVGALAEPVLRLSPKAGVVHMAVDHAPLAAQGNLSSEASDEGSSSESSGGTSMKP